MRIAFFGHVSIDVDVTGGETHTHSGGGVLHGCITAQRLGAPAVLVTKCRPEDRASFTAPAEAGVEVRFLASATTTSIRNVHPADDPDLRESQLLASADPFVAADLDGVECGALHVNPLWRGEFPDELLVAARDRTPLLSADAQGFQRAVGDDGQMTIGDWTEKRRYLPLLDLFKADGKEARALTGADDPRDAADELFGWGPRTVLVTHAGGLVVRDADGRHEAAFSPYTLEGRTGRGDTTTAAYLVARFQHDAAEAARFAAQIASRKMQYRGPYRGS